MAETSSSRQLLVLLYKGWLFRKRHYIITFFEIIIPVFIASIFPMINISGPPGGQDRKAVIYEAYSPYSNFAFDDNNIQFVYAPSNNLTDPFMEKVIEKFTNNTNIKRKNTKTVKLHTEKDIEVYCISTDSSGKRINLIGTVFSNFDSSPRGLLLPHSLDYKIRYADQINIADGFNTEKKYRYSNRFGSNTKYRESYFLAWQTAVEETFIAQKIDESGKIFDYQVSMQKLPYPEYKTKEDGSLIQQAPLLLGYGFYIFMLNILGRLIEEKSNGSKELMKMMGMTDFVYWTSTFLNYFTVGVMTTLLISIIYCTPSPSLLNHSNFILFFLLLLLYVTALILFCMAFTILFNKAVYAIIVFIIMEQVSFVLLMSMFFFADPFKYYYPLSTILKLAICLIPSGGLLTIFHALGIYESSGEGVQWYNLTDYVINSDLNMLMIMAAVLFSCFLYILIIWYFDKVWPWQPGVPQPFYFMFTRNYWCSTKPCETDDIELLKQSDRNEEYFEEEPHENRPGVTIQNISKEFQVGFQTKLAVNEVSLNIYEGQITALLGHNGAGKTTIINMLTGLYTPSSGTASINGMDILKDTISARRGLGVCPQHNVLYDTLTVDEHLKIFAGLKGVKWSEVETESNNVLKILKLTEKRSELVKNLSGGMKRKLCLANSIVGGSKVLFLDEPTSGMDVEARRNVWDALLNIRQDRTIILTTHYMEEADILGDRIAIMAEGEIQCCGSPIFLKRKFGTGYHLHMVKTPGFNLENTNALLERHIPGMTVEKEIENEITYNLSSKSGRALGDMFEDLEKRKEELGIMSCGVSITTMEDVFLNVSNISDIKYLKKGGKRHLQHGVSMEYDDVYGTTTEMKPRKLHYQLFALLEKRFHYTKRHWSILSVQMVLPFVLICLCFGSISLLQVQFQMTFVPLKLNISSVYGQTDGFYYTETNKNLTDDLNNVFRENNIKASETDEPINYTLNYGKNDLTKYSKKLIVGGNVDVFTNRTFNLTAWYNSVPYHSSPMTLLLMHTAILRYVSPEKEATITLTNAPLPRIYIPDPSQSYGRVESSFATIFIPLAVSFISATFVLLPIHERAKNIKLLQLMTGLRSYLYWAAMFFWDFGMYFILSLLFIIPFALFDKVVFFASQSNAIAVVVLLFWFYGFASIPLSYFLSLVFKKGNVGFAFVVALNTIVGIAAGSTILSLYSDADPNTEAKLEFFVWLFRFVPAFTISSGFYNLFSIAYRNAYCDKIPKGILESNCNSSAIRLDNPLFQCCEGICGDKCFKPLSYMRMDKDACGRDFLMLFIDGFLFFLLLLLFETNLFQRMCNRINLLFMRLRKRVPGDVNQPAISEDSDVIAEEQRVKDACDGYTTNEALVALELSKIFSNFYAVDHLSFGINQEECFGLLGVNGAGKTTTFKMLTGDCQPTSGNAISNGCALVTDAKKFQSYLGYCPQFDALIDRLTGRETLTLFARLRGLSGSELQDRVNKLIKMTDLSAHADKQTQFYSGGNKRKLSVGMALIGSPPIILLDEPTAGVDPVSRRKIWNILAQARSHTKAAVILTTHSMEESEALCSRLAIMVNGRFRCLGSIQQLKAKYGQGYTLIVKMRKEAADDPQGVKDIQTNIEHKLSGAHLKDDHQGMLQYHITDVNVRLSQLFKIMEEMKVQFNLEDYLISDTSLEQIFLTFARAQRVAE